MAFATDLAAQRKDLAARLGRVGVWTFALDRTSASEAREFVAAVEEMGFRALWIPEGLGSKEAFVHAAVLLAAGRSLVVATGIASIWARDPVAMANGARALEDAFPGRFVLGMGVSHEFSVSRRGHEYRQPYRRMVAYLKAMEEARYTGPNKQGWPPIVLAALGPRMLRLAAERTAGAHPYFVPVEHTEFARRTMGPGPLLLPEQAAVLETDPGRARAVARAFMEHYLELPNYANNLRRLGWKEEDLAGGGSDRLVDAIVAWGDVEAVRARVRAHLDAGADHVSVQVLTEDPRRLPTPELRELAPALVE
ncbi:MAG TPA: LLM class F420-dependent oxidoreductase [Actinomycetota bacterium]|nr:LLM class F420-dependent oxidoreductase [Actinomycetota bacterium]